MKINLKYKNKKINLDVKICKYKFLGLMFSRKESVKALLFDFKKPVRISIHSFFCPGFVAVWLDENNNILEIKKIKPFTFRVFPKKSFTKLIEIPCSSKYYNIVKSLCSRPRSQPRAIKRFAKSLVGDAKDLNSK